MSAYTDAQMAKEAWEVCRECGLTPRQLADQRAELLAEVEKLRLALRLVWRIHVRDNVHLGLERGSGIQNDCIPCICGCALGLAMDGTTAKQLEARLRVLSSEQAARDELARAKAVPK